MRHPYVQVPRYALDIDNPEPAYAVMSSDYQQELEVIIPQLEMAMTNSLCYGYSFLFQCICLLLRLLCQFRLLPMSEDIILFGRVSGIGVGRVALMQYAYEVSICRTISFCHIRSVSIHESHKRHVDTPGSNSFSTHIFHYPDTFIYRQATAACTSVVVNDEHLHCPVHVRTMDWSFQDMNWTTERHVGDTSVPGSRDFSIDLRPLTIEIEYQRHGQTVFYATTWVGFLGVYTGMYHYIKHIFCNTHVWHINAYQSAVDINVPFYIHTKITYVPKYNHTYNHT